MSNGARVNFTSNYEAGKEGYRMKPILFNGDMVRAILEERKTVTRRVIKPQPEYCTMSKAGLVVSEKPIEISDGIIKAANAEVRKPPFEAGDILYVRETWTPGLNGSYVYKASVECPDAWKGSWRPSIHMPKEAARLFLRVADVRVERLQKITIDDARKEGVARENVRAGGCTCAWATEGCMDEPCSNRDAYDWLCWVTPFQRLWDSTIKSADRALYGFEANPWVWVIEFEQCERKEEGL